MPLGFKIQLKVKQHQRQGFDKFRRQMEYKTQLYGNKLVVVDIFYPSIRGEFTYILINT